MYPYQQTAYGMDKLGLCLGGKGQLIRCVTRGEGRGAEGRGGERERRGAEGSGGERRGAEGSGGGNGGERSGGERRGAEGSGGRGGERRGGEREEGGGRGGMTVIHIIMMSPYIQTNNEELYVYNNDVTHYVTTCKAGNRRQVLPICLTHRSDPWVKLTYCTHARFIL